MLLGTLVPAIANEQSETYYDPTYHGETYGEPIDHDETYDELTYHEETYSESIDYEETYNEFHDDISEVENHEDDVYLIEASYIEITPFNANVSTQADLQLAINESTIANGHTRANPRVITITQDILLNNQAITIPAGVNFQLITDNPNGVSITRNLPPSGHQPRHFHFLTAGQTAANSPDRTFILGQAGNPAASNITLNVLENATITGGVVSGTVLSHLRTCNQDGGGVTVHTAATGNPVNAPIATANTQFIMHEGTTITGGRHNDNAGALRFGTGVTFIMEGGRLINNAANVDAGVQGDGGAVFLSGTAEMIMNGGEISGNWRQGGAGNTTLTTGGGGIFLNIDHHSAQTGAAAGTGPTFTMNGGVIRDNWILQGVGGGGGVHVGAGATFNMNGGIISDHFATGANQGGGVLVRGSGVFNMNGGEITGNTSAQNGGGVWVASTATFNMTAGTITHNTVGRTITVNNPGSSATGMITFPNGFNPDGSPVTQYIANRNLANGGGVFTQTANFSNINVGIVNGNNTSSSVHFYGNRSAAHDGSPLLLIENVPSAITTFSNIRWNNYANAHNVQTTSLPALPAHILNNWDINMSTNTSQGGVGGYTPFDFLRILTMENGGNNAYMSSTHPDITTTTNELLTLAGSTATINAGTRTGFSFSHWTTVPVVTGIHNSDTATASGIMPAQNVTATAHWTRAVTFNLASGNIGGNTTNPVIDVLEFGTIGALQPADPVRENYDFGGWTMPDSTIVLPGDPFPDNLPDGAFTVVAVWHPTMREVTFEANGSGVTGLPVSGMIEVQHGQSIGTANFPTSPERAGFSFVSWNTAADGSGNAFTASTVVLANTTVYAQWDANMYTITFNPNSGVLGTVPATLRVQEGSSAGADFPTGAPTRQFWSFTGWNTQANGQGTTFDANTIIAGNITVFAQWERITVTVTFAPNGSGVTGIPAPVTLDAGTTLGAQFPTAPTRSGYAFGGWNTAANGSGTTVNANAVITENITVHAQWNDQMYTVTFNANGGALGQVPATVRVQQGSNAGADFPTGTPVRQLWRFTGWNTQPNGSGTSFDDSTIVTGNITVFAQWERMTHTVTFDPNAPGVTGVPADITVNSGATLGAQFPTEHPARSGHVFLGWNTEANGSGVVVTANRVITGDQTFYAIWQEATPEIWISNSTMRRNTLLQVSIIGPNPNGYTVRVAPNPAAFQTVQPIQPNGTLRAMVQGSHRIELVGTNGVPVDFAIVVVTP
jgi:uncharacterized repeat protein (TIGR02543 family)